RVKRANRRRRTKRPARRHRRVARSRRRRRTARRGLPARAVRRVPRKWAEWPSERLLDVRVCDLPVRIEGTELSRNIRRLYDELKTRDLRFRPHFWLSDEWFSPDGIPGIALPFFLAHPRLRRLEREMMLEVEGESSAERIKLLRHEAGHALLNAYRLNRRRDWQQVFGRSSERYPDTYVPRPHSKRFVLHLPNWYAQAHPHEDWAETFAVWLRPNSDWRKRYRGWPALKKLEYVERLMQEIRERPAILRNRREALPLRGLKLTLREYYAEKQKRYRKDKLEFSDVDLSQLFSDAEEHKTNEKASRYIRRNKSEIMDIVSRWTSEYNYRINDVLQEMIDRCDTLDLRVARDDVAMKPEIAACLTALVMNKLHTGGFRVSL
ncbi:MAG TPA: putative zinc-binding metallopeptidase, partial [Burkholderiales bacterium]|nr:putative zinc-binding metallopeptidase [Burkholderiales bacterium]